MRKLVSALTLVLAVVNPNQPLFGGDEEVEDLASIVSKLASNDSTQVQSALKRLAVGSSRLVLNSDQLLAVADVLQSNNEFRVSDAANALFAISARQPQDFSDAVVTRIATALGETTNARLRCEILRILCELRENAHPALSAVRDLSQSDSVFVKAWALTAIACIDPSDKDPINTMESWLKSSDKNHRALALVGLGVVGANARSALQSMRGRLRDEAPAVRVLSAQSIWRIESDSTGLIDVLAASIEEPPVSVLYKPPYASEWVISHNGVALLTLGRMAQFKRDEILPILERALQSPETETRVFAAKALTAIEDKEAVAILRTALSDCSPAVQLVARNALANKPK